MGAGIYRRPAFDAELDLLVAAGFREAVILTLLLDQGDAVTVGDQVMAFHDEIRVLWADGARGPMLIVEGPDVTLVTLVRPLDLARYEREKAAGAALDPRGPIASPADWFEPVEPGGLRVDVYNTEVFAVKAS